MVKTKVIAWPPGRAGEHAGELNNASCVGVTKSEWPKTRFCFSQQQHRRQWSACAPYGVQLRCTEYKCADEKTDWKKSALTVDLLTPVGFAFSTFLFVGLYVISNGVNFNSVLDRMTFKSVKIFNSSLFLFERWW